MKEEELTDEEIFETLDQLGIEYPEDMEDYEEEEPDAVIAEIFLCDELTPLTEEDFDDGDIENVLCDKINEIIGVINGRKHKSS